MRVFVAWMMSLTIAGEMVREIGSTTTLISMAGLSFGPLRATIMEQGRRIYNKNKWNTQKNIISDDFGKWVIFIKPSHAIY